MAIVEYTEKLRQALSQIDVPIPTVSPYQFELLDTANLDLGNEIDKQGEWEKAANIYWTVFETATEPKERAIGLISTVQMLINHNELERATYLLENELPSLQTQLSGRDSTYIEAYAATKPGWVADMEGRHDEAIVAFQRAKELIGEPQSEEEEITLSVCRHFIGRNATQNAIHGINAEVNFALGRQNFLEDRRYWEEQIAKGKGNSMNLAFQDHWLVTIAVYQGDLREAEAIIERERSLVDEFVYESPKSGARGYYYHDLAVLEVAHGNMEQARDYFDQELKQWTEVQQYGRGQADALMGIAMCLLAEGQNEEAQTYLERAVAANPKIKQKGFI